MNDDLTERTGKIDDDVRGEYETKLDPLPTTSAAKLTVEGARERRPPHPCRFHPHYGLPARSVFSSTTPVTSLDAIPLCRSAPPPPAPPHPSSLALLFARTTARGNPPHLVHPHRSPRLTKPRTESCCSLATVTSLSLCLPTRPYRLTPSVAHDTCFRASFLFFTDLP